MLKTIDSENKEAIKRGIWQRKAIHWHLLSPISLVLIFLAYKIKYQKLFPGSLLLFHSTV